jgi:hypothetical protein
MKPKEPKPPRPVHPGLDLSTKAQGAWCRKCRWPVEFRDVWGNGHELGICDCGLWVKDPMEFVRLVRFDTDRYVIGHDGPMFSSRNLNPEGQQGRQLNG